MDEERISDGEVRALSSECVNASFLGEHDRARKLLDAGADPNRIVRHQNRDTTATIEAARCLDAPMVELMLGAGGDLAFEVDGRVPLYWSIWQPNSDEFCEWLMDLPQHRRVAGDLNIKTLVDLAASGSGRPRVLRTLLLPPYREGLRDELALAEVLLPAIRSATPEMVSVLIETGSPLAAPTKDGNESVLGWAVCAAQLESVKLLLAAGEDPNISERGMSLLHYAVQVGNGPVLRALLAAGADPQARTEDGEAASVMQTALEKSPACARLLVSEGHVPGLSQSELDSELVRAVRAGREGAVKLLLEWGADHTSKVGGRSLLQLAPVAAEGVKRLLRSQRLGERMDQALGSGPADVAPTSGGGPQPL